MTDTNLLLDAQEFLPENLKDNNVMLEVVDLLNTLVSTKEETLKVIYSAFMDAVYKKRDFNKLSYEAKIMMLSEMGFDYILNIIQLTDSQLSQLLIFFNLIYTLKGKEEGLRLVLDTLEFTYDYEVWDQADPKDVPFTAKLKIVDGGTDPDLLTKLTVFVRSYMLVYIYVVIVRSVNAPPLYIFGQDASITRIRDRVPVVDSATVWPVAIYDIHDYDESLYGDSTMPNAHSVRINPTPEASKVLIDNVEKNAITASDGSIHSYLVYCDPQTIIHYWKYIQTTWAQPLIWDNGTYSGNRLAVYRSSSNGGYRGNDAWGAFCTERGWGGHYTGNYGDEYSTWLDIYISIPVPIKLSSYSYYIPTVDSAMNWGSVRSTQFWGSDDNANWVQLHSTGGLSQDTQLTFNINPSKAYRYYRYRYTTIGSGHRDFSAVCSFRLNGTETTVKEVTKDEPYDYTTTEIVAYEPKAGNFTITKDEIIDVILQRTDNPTNIYTFKIEPTPATSMVSMNGIDINQLKVLDGTSVEWMVTATSEYIPQTGTELITEDTTLEVVLKKHTNILFYCYLANFYNSSIGNFACYVWFPATRLVGDKLRAYLSEETSTYKKFVPARQGDDTNLSYIDGAQYNCFEVVEDLYCDTPTLTTVQGNEPVVAKCNMWTAENPTRVSTSITFTRYDLWDIIEKV